MRTNLVDLMSEASKLERECLNLHYILKSDNTNSIAIELDGKEQVLNEYPQFEEQFNEYQAKLELLNKIRAVIFEKNNSLKLSTGDTIQSALVAVANKRKLLQLVEELSTLNNSKKRMTEVNNSYFISKELAFDKNRMKELAENLKLEIKDIEFEISELNAQVFEIEI